MTENGTATRSTVSIPVRLDFDSIAPAFEKALTHLGNAATRELDRAGINAGLRELIRVRASQLNGCAYCVDMHTKDADAVGESAARLVALPVWRETPFFTAAERAALAFTESVVQMSATHVPQEDFDGVAEHFTAEQIAALISLIISINAWNAVGVAARPWPVGTYER